MIVESRDDVLARTNSPMELLPLTTMDGHFCCSATGGLLHWLAATVDLQLLQHSSQRNINIMRTTRHGMLLRPQVAGQQHTFHN
jgi:hypothetical protein